MFTLKSRIQVLKSNIDQCDKNIKYHTNVIKKNTELIRRSSNPTQKKLASEIVRARQGAIALNKQRKAAAMHSLSRLMNELSRAH